MPTVSIVIPTYNRSDLLPVAIRSVLNQTFDEIEVVIVDDGSTDSTRQVAEEFLIDRRVKYIYQSNAGRSVARNCGLHVTCGEFIGFLDSDDYYVPEAVTAHLRLFTNTPELGMAIGGYYYIDEQGEFVGERLPWAEGGGLDQSGWLLNCFAMPGSVLIRRDWLERVGFFDPDCEIAEDWDLFLRLAQADCPMAWTHQIVCYYRQHAGNSIRIPELHTQGALRALDKFFKSPHLKSQVAALQNKAITWEYLRSGKSAYQYGQSDVARHHLQQSLLLDPELSNTLLEFLFSPMSGSDVVKVEQANSIRNCLPENFRITNLEIDYALARVEMALFFRNSMRGDIQAAASHLKSGLRLDMRWLANRGVLSFCARYFWGKCMQ